MTPYEQKQTDTALAYMQRQMGILALEGANQAARAAALALRVEELTAEVATLKKPAAPAQKTKVVK